jgi:hypothetical protein
MEAVTSESALVGMKIFVRTSWRFARLVAV